MEQQVVEYKLIWKDEYLAWICGFANAQGGCLFIGIDDRGDIVGLNNAQKLLEDIPNKIANTMGLVADINLLSEKEKEYLQIKVAPSNSPISYHGKFYYRSGATNQELRGTALQQFFLHKFGRSWDETINEYATLEDIDREAIDYFMHSAIAYGRLNYIHSQETTENILDKLQLLSPDKKHLTNAAILLFCNNPSRFFPDVEFKIGRFGSTPYELITQDSIKGNLIQMADRVLDVLKTKYLHTLISYDGIHRVERLEIPENALREMVINAIVHKRYPGVHIQMRIYDDHIQIWNEGGLPEGYTIEKLRDNYISKARNQLIASVFHMAGLVERWGRGITLIQNDFLNAGLEVPNYQADANSFMLTFKRNVDNKSELNVDNKTEQNNTLSKTLQLIDTENDNTLSNHNKVDNKSTSNIDNKSGLKVDNKTSTLRLVFSLIASDPQITQTEIVDILQISRTSVTNHIRTLQEKGHIRRIGSRKTGYWEVIKSL